MKKTIRKIWNTLTGTLVAVVMIFAVLTIGVRLVGLDAYVVLSGSMEPAYQTGSVIYVKEVEPEELKTGDVITFYLDSETVATHRIVEITEKDDQIAYRTKGDANEVEDGEAVLESQLIGTPIFTIPYLGYLVQYIQTTSGRYATIALGGVLLLMICLPDMLFGEEKKSKEKAE